jgi:cyclopropane fatty-acyl-phospholipid synthase-like methyltransferase
MHPDTTAVRAYYQQNTRLFRIIGRAATALATHRAVWSDGARTHAQALQTVNRRLAARCTALAHATGRAPHVLDLGCGVGGSLITIAHHSPAVLVGVTISHAQARIAAAALRRYRLATRCHVLEADYHTLPLAGPFDLIAAIESLVHAAEPDRVWREIARLLRPGGQVVLIDDMLAAGTPGHPLVATVMRGWCAPALSTPHAIIALAERHGLRCRSDDDLTAATRPRAIPAALTALVIALGRRVPLAARRTHSQLGSIALQAALHAGVLQYRQLVFERPGD